jgi:anti-sigma regulatory factor (Ser/Thr protein kinase)
MDPVAHTIRGGDYEHGGAAARSVKEQLKKVGADPAVVRRAMIAAYEAEMNVVIHARQGELRASLDNGQLHVDVVDEGPGIADIATAMREGFSTAPTQARELGFGAGLGLPNIRKNSDYFEIESAVGRGTRVSFRIALRPQALYGAGRHSLRVVGDKCRPCLRCLHVCPTHAIRVFRGRPQILDYLCVDCTACIAACPTGALRMEEADPPVPAPAGGILVIPAPCLAQYGRDVAPQRVLAELAALGWGDVRLMDAWDDALRAAVVEYARNESSVRPVISPACPAVVNLIATRFPSLIPHVAPLVSAMEAAQAELAGAGAAFVALCPSQRTALSGDVEATPRPAIVPPAVVRAALLPRLASIQRETRESPPRPSIPPTRREVLCASGMQHVVAVLEQIENGLAGDIPVIELWACEEGCFGSPLLTEDPFLARHRWQMAPCGSGHPAQVIRRKRPLSPRPGLRLDDDMTKAIAKLGRIDKLRRSLPGDDCALCGAPTCGALAEDIVLGRAALGACVRRADEDSDRKTAAPEENQR